MLSDLVKIKPEHANGRTKFLSQEFKDTIKSTNFVDTFLHIFFWVLVKVTW